VWIFLVLVVIWQLVDWSRGKILVFHAFAVLYFVLCEERGKYAE
jgi:hypothetical protein